MASVYSTCAVFALVVEYLKYKPGRQRWHNGIRLVTSRGSYPKHGSPAVSVLAL